MPEYIVSQNTGDEWRITRREFTAFSGPERRAQLAYYITVEQKQWKAHDPGQTRPKRRTSHYVIVDEIPVLQAHYADMMEQLRLIYDMRKLIVRDIVVPDLSSPPALRR